MKLLTANLLSELKNYLKVIDESIEGEGTYIRQNSSPSKWAHVAIKIIPTESRYLSAHFTEKTVNFPESYKTEISEVTDIFALVYTFSTGTMAQFRIEIVDATYRPAETTYNDFYIATINALKNAINNSLHVPDLDQVKKYKFMG